MLKYKLILLSNKTTLTSLHSKGLSIFMSMPFLLRRYLSVMWIWEEKFSLILSVVLRSFNCVEVHHPTKLIMSNHHWLFLSLCRSYWLQWSASLSPGCGRLSCVPVSLLWSPVTEPGSRSSWSGCWRSWGCPCPRCSTPGCSAPRWRPPGRLSVPGGSSPGCQSHPGNIHWLQREKIKHWPLSSRIFSVPLLFRSATASDYIYHCMTI